MTSTSLDPDGARTDTTSSEFDDWVNVGYYAPGFRDAIAVELDRLSELDENWDAQGAHPIDRETIDAARNFVQLLPDNLISPPAVVPMAKGNLQFEWHKGPRSLELEFESPTTLHYLKWHPEEGVEDEGVFPLTEIGRAVGLIRWFARGVANV
jgi:hypothetical protein